jgi:uncharacterized damage-inducible protein DinB
VVPECQQFLDSLCTLNGRLGKTVDGLDPDSLDWLPVDGANSIAVIVTHAMGAERFLIAQLVGGTDIHRDREAEFKTRQVNAAHLRAAIDQATRDAEAVLSRITEDELGRQRPYHDEARPVRWFILHAVEHVAEHLGQAELTRQLLDARSRG